jgi:hypothetical protein
LWPGCLDATGEGKIKDDHIRQQTQLSKQRLSEALQQVDDLELRRCAACQLTALAAAVWVHKEHADVKRSRAHTAQRLAAGGSAALAAGSGGALAAGLGGTTAKVFGIIVLVIGIVTGAGAALLPESEYERNRGKSRQYAQLWRDIWTYATLELPSARASTIAGQIKRFSADISAVGDT